MKNHDFQELVDRNLSGLVWDERKRQQVLLAVSEEERPVRKISLTFVLVAAILCLTVSALAAGLVFSPRVDAEKLADEALYNEYGIAPEMMTFFNRTSAQEGGAIVVRYEGQYAFSFVLGRYTVTVKGSQADAVWSWDGTDTSKGFDGAAWGAEQLATLCRENQNGLGLSSYANLAKRIAWEHNVVIADPVPFNEAEYKALAEKEAREAEIAKAAATLSEEEMEAIAREAVALRYAFDEEAVKCMLEWEENRRYLVFGDDEVPCCGFYFSLGFEDDGYKGPAGRGIYHVLVNVESGTVEGIVYDSDLGGEG